MKGDIHVATMTIRKSRSTVCKMSLLDGTMDGGGQKLFFVFLLLTAWTQNRKSAYRGKVNRRDWWYKLCDRTLNLRSSWRISNGQIDGSNRWIRIENSTVLRSFPFSFFVLSFFLCIARFAATSLVPVPHTVEKLALGIAYKCRNHGKEDRGIWCCYRAC